MNRSAQPSAAPFWGWSPEARAMRHPFATYRALVDAPPDVSRTWLVLRRPLMVLFLIGGFVALTAAGRLTATHLTLSMVFWAFAPLHQIITVTVLHGLFRPARPWSRAVDLYFVGHGPWLLLLYVLAGITLFAPSVYDAFTALLRTGVLPGLAVLTIGWSAVLTYAYFRVGLELSRGRAWVATVAYYVIYVGLIVTWYLATFQLQPQIPG